MNAKRAVIVYPELQLLYFVIKNKCCMRFNPFYTTYEHKGNTGQQWLGTALNKQLRTGSSSSSELAPGSLWWKGDIRATIIWRNTKPDTCTYLFLLQHICFSQNFHSVDMSCVFFLYQADLGTYANLLLGLYTLCPKWQYQPTNKSFQHNKSNI